MCCTPSVFQFYSLCMAVNRKVSQAQMQSGYQNTICFDRSVPKLQCLVSWFLCQAGLFSAIPLVVLALWKGFGADEVAFNQRSVWQIFGVWSTRLGQKLYYAELNCATRALVTGSTGMVQFSLQFLQHLGPCWLRFIIRFRHVCGAFLRNIYLYILKDCASLCCAFRAWYRGPVRGWLLLFWCGSQNASGSGPAST